MRSRIIASGSYVPSLKISNDDLGTIMDTNDEWIVKRTGIKTRYFETQSNAHMAIEACKKLDVDFQSIDCIIVCTYTPDDAIPTLANRVKAGIGIINDVPCFDLNAACSGFIYGLEVADGLLLSRKYKRILLIGSDFNSRVMDFHDRGTSILFGDGAGAVVLELGETGGLIDNIIAAKDDEDGAISLKSATDFNNPLNIREIEKDSFFKMKGSDVFKFAIKTCTSAIETMINKHCLSKDDIDYVIAHQANQRILETSAKMLGIPFEKFPVNLDRYGNTSAASIPILLDEMFKDGLLKPKMKILLVAFGGGLSYGVSYIEIT